MSFGVHPVNLKGEVLNTFERLAGVHAVSEKSTSCISYNQEFWFLL